MRVDINSKDMNIQNPKGEVTNTNTISPDKENAVKQSENRDNQASFPGEKKLIDALSKVNEQFLGDQTSLKFSIHEKTKDIMVKVIDNKTKEVIKEIPSEKILDMVADMCEKAGIFVDKKG